MIKEQRKTGEVFMLAVFMLWEFARYCTQHHSKKLCDVAQQCYASLVCDLVGDVVLSFGDQKSECQLVYRSAPLIFLICFFFYVNNSNIF